MSVISASDNAIKVPLGYLFLDVEDSTARWERTPARMRKAMARHRAIVDALVAAHGGVIHDFAGDGAFAIFDGGSPLKCALAIQLAMQREDWSAVGGLDLRLGVHLATPTDDGSVDQISANRAARITASGWGGQIVVSNEAMEAYGAPEGARFVDLGFTHFRGVEAPIRLSALVHPDLNRQDFPPLRVNAFENLTLPQPAGPLFGRERDMIEIQERLYQTRLLTIVAPGGTGKTRLAWRIASDSARDRPVVFVSLDGVSNEAEFVSSLAGALRFPFYGGAARERQLLDYLRDKSTMLVLDNADAMAGHAAFASQLASTCIGLTILTTSREPLHTMGEVVYRLSGLSFGGADLTQSPAFQLFAFEAHAQGSDRPVSQEVDQFREICGLIDGSPLALRLVARWSRLLSLSDILVELRRGPEFLSNASQSDLRLSLTGVFEGSWRLLTPTQQRALSRLSVFAGPFDFEAASDVAELDLATYASLVDKSLLDDVGNRRFSIHPLIRSYARGKLALDSDDEAHTRRRHAAYYLRMVCEKATATGGNDRSVRFDELQDAYANIRAAWWHANKIRLPDVADAAVLLHHFLAMRSMIKEGIEAFSIDLCDPALRPLFQGLLAASLFQHGELDAADAAARSVFAARGGIVPRAFGREALGGVAHVRGDYPRARRHYERGFALWSLCESELNGSFTATNLALLHSSHGQDEEAAKWGRLAYRLSRRSGNPVGVRIIQVMTGDQAMRAKRFDAARANYEKALRFEVSGETPAFRGSVLRRLGSLCRDIGDLDQALSYHRQALDLAVDTGERRMQAFAVYEVGEDLRRLAEFDEATACLVDAVQRAEALGLDPLLNEGLLSLGQMLIARDAKTNARRVAGLLAERELDELAGRYSELCETLGDPPPARVPMEDLGELLEDIVDEAEIGVFE